MKQLAELLNLSGKSAIVTGGAKGIGKGIAYRLAEAGASVLIADLDETAAKATAEELVSKGWKAESFAVDVADEEQVKAMVGACKDHFGTVDILVNNAGIYPPMPIMQMSVELFDQVQSVMTNSE